MVPLFQNSTFSLPYSPAIEQIQVLRTHSETGKSSCHARVWRQGNLFRHKRRACEDSVDRPVLNVWPTVIETSFPHLSNTYQSSRSHIGVPVSSLILQPSPIPRVRASQYWMTGPMRHILATENLWVVDIVNAHNCTGGWKIFLSAASKSLSKHLFISCKYLSFRPFLYFPPFCLIKKTHK